MSGFTRKFSFDIEDRPIFGINSPWNQPAGNPVPDSERRARAVFDILREESSYNSIPNAITEILDVELIFAEIEECRRKCEADRNSDECRTCEAKITNLLKNSARLVADQGGNLQSPTINFNTYCFPIFETAITDEFLGELRIASYDGTTFLKQALPPKFPPTTNPEVQSPTLSFEVPVRTKPRPASQSSSLTRLMRSAGPATRAADGALILYDPDTYSEFDFWQAKLIAGEELASGRGGETGETILCAGAIAFFKTQNGGGAFPSEGTQFVDGLIERDSARASGLPYLGGLLVAEDLKIPPGGTIENITIDHALAFVLPRLRYVPYPQTGDPPNFVYPASSTETHNYTINPYALAAGQRIRLKADGDVLTVDDRIYFDLPAIRPITRIFLQALRTYGAYLVDGGGGFGFAAEDYRTSNLKMSREDLVRLLGYEVDPGPSVVPIEPTEPETWKLLMEQLNESLSGFHPFKRADRLTFGFGDNHNGYHMNFEVVEDKQVPAP